MAQMTDPMNALVELQKAIRRGMPTDIGDIHRKLTVVADNPNGVARYTYAKVENGRVKAIALFVICEPYEGLPCFNVGWAVPEAYRGRGWATEIFQQGLQELKNGLARHGGKEFYIEAVIGVDNLASQRVAEKVLGCQPIKTIDRESGEPALAYHHRVTA